MRRRALAVAVAALAAAAPASGAADRDALVRPGVGIGKIRLGMTPAQVFRALGRSALVNRRLSRGFGTRYVEYEWSYGMWTVGFTGRADRLRVTKVGTRVRRERTATRLGTGSRARDILRAYPNARCVARWPSDPDPGTWIYIGARPRITAFNIVYVGNARRSRVAEVVVQRDWIVRSRTFRCLPDWRTR